MVNLQKAMGKYLTKTTYGKGVRNRADIVCMYFRSCIRYCRRDFSQLVWVLLSLKKADNSNINSLLVIKGAPVEFVSTHPLAPNNLRFSLLGKRIELKVCDEFLRTQRNHQTSLRLYILSIVAVAISRLALIGLSVLESIPYILGFLTYSDCSTKKFVSQER